MKTERRNLALAVIATTTALLLGTPMAALAAPVDTTATPDSFCTWSGADNDIAVCEPIPYRDWVPTTVEQHPEIRAQLNLASGNNPGLPSPSGINSVNTVSSGDMFAVEPADVTALPLTSQTAVSMYSPNLEIQSFFATVVSEDTWGDYNDKRSMINGNENSYASWANPFEGLPGEVKQVVPAGTTFDVPFSLREEADWGSSFDLTLDFATPTYVVETNGVANAIGYMAIITAVVEDINTGEFFTVSDRQIYTYYSFYSPDLQQLAPSYAECEISGTQVCAAGGTFPIGVEAYYVVPAQVLPPVEPPVVVPPVVDPPVVTPPVVTPPVATPEPEPTPDGPRVESGADSSQQLGWFPLAISAGILLGLFPVLFAVRRRERAEQ